MKILQYRKHSLKGNTRFPFWELTAAVDMIRKVYAYLSASLYVFACI